MSEKIKDGGPAFPAVNEFGENVSGLSLRDYFAAKVMQAIFAGEGARMVANRDERYDQTNWAEIVSSNAYDMADAMIAEREGESSLALRLERIVVRTNALQPCKTSVEKIVADMEKRLDERESTRADYNARVAASKAQEEAEAEAQKQFAVGDCVQWTEFGKTRNGKIARFGSHPLGGPYMDVTPMDGKVSFSDIAVRVIANNVIKIEGGSE